MNVCGRSNLVFGVSLVALLTAAAGWLWGRAWVPEWWLGVLCGAAAWGLFVAVLMRLLPSPADTGTLALNRRYRREFLPPMGAYVLATLAVAWLLPRAGDAQWLRAAIALLPVAPLALAVRAMVRYVRDVDELQQRIELEAICIATALVALGYLAAGFLQLARVIDVPAGMAMILVFPLICAVYAVAKAVVSRRYA